jgi:tetratricopeptide (TPR) repeat protein
MEFLNASDICLKKQTISDLTISILHTFYRMSGQRLTLLQQYYKEDPGDPFNIYALALEYLKYDTGKSAELFEILLTNHESYIPTYYHAGKLYEQQGDSNRAIRIYEKGMEQSKKVNDVKAFRELKAACDELMME